MKIYLYGMKLRGYSPYGQPKEGLLGTVQPVSAGLRDVFHDIVIYNRELTDMEVSKYDLKKLWVIKGAIANE